MYVGKFCPGIMTEKSSEACTGGTCCGYAIFRGNPDSREISVTASGELKEEIGLKRCSNMAMIRNIDISTAVATKPYEIALAEAPRLFHGASVPNPAWDGLDTSVEHEVHGFDLSGTNASIFLLLLCLASPYFALKFHLVFVQLGPN